MGAMPSPLRYILRASLPLALLSLFACPGTAIHRDARDQVPDATSHRDTRDPVAGHGAPCTGGACDDGLICIGNVCRLICSTSCGDFAPECPEGNGCYLMTSFSSACLPGTAELGELCPQGIVCNPGLLCVSWNNEPHRCLQLCSQGCPDGTQCNETNEGCEICVD